MRQKISVLSKLCEVFPLKAEVALDIETVGKKPLDALRYADQELIGISLCDGEKNVYVDLYNNEERNEIISYLKEHLKPGLVVMANAPFDLAGLNKEGLYTGKEKVWDICTSDHLIDENNVGKHGLKAQAERYLSVKTNKYDETLHPNSDEFAEYALNDSLWTYQIYKIHKQRLQDEGLLNFMKIIEMPYVHCVTQMRIEGVTVDWYLNDYYINLVKDEMTNYLIQMSELVGCKYSRQANLIDNSIIVETEINFNSSNQVAEIIQDKLNIDLTETTDSGAIKLDKHVLNSLKGRHKFIDLLLEYKKLMKTYSAFLEPLQGFKESDGKIRPSFINWGTVSGRLASSKPNLQQLPNSGDEDIIQVRKQFIAPKGYKMLTADYSGFELRIMASISNDKNMIETLNQGRDADLHQKTADLMGVERKVGKIFNFSIAYGKGVTGFSNDLGITESEAEKLIEQFNKAYPDVAREIKNTHNELERRGFVKNAFGRKRRLPPIKNEDGTSYQPNRHKRQSFNFKAQSLAGDILRHTSSVVYKQALKRPEMDLKLIMTVHDENVYVVRETFLEEAKTLIQRCFENVIKDKVKFFSDVKEGNSYQEAK